MKYKKEITDWVQGLKDNREWILNAHNPITTQERVAILMGYLKSSELVIKMLSEED